MAATNRHKDGRTEKTDGRTNRQTDIHKDKQTNYLKDGGQRYETNQLGQKTERQNKQTYTGPST